MREKMKMLITKLKNQKGFTLIELMATLAILALIVAIAIPAVGSIIDKAEKGADEANVALIENSAQLAYLGTDLAPATPVAGVVYKKDTYTAAELVSGGFLNVEPEGAALFDAGYTLTRDVNTRLFVATVK